MGHDHIHTRKTYYSKAFALGIGLNIAFVVVEAFIVLK
jgi:hypothetical protein